ncbi:MAG: hypothetical protein C4542_09635 [Dehalococcoidia bacterium]|nr:MAG: hypothetical protein C4542_09635 [Dehalococcoidia bacterium]
MAGALDWSFAETGKPITLNGYRGSGVYGGLTAEQQVRFGREYLLGDGIYIAPTPRTAGHFGTPEPAHVNFSYPYVLQEANGATLRALDIEAIRAAGHDGIIIKRGQWGFGAGQEDLRQAVLFPQYAARFGTGHVALEVGVLQKGARVRIERVTGPPDYVRDFRAGALAQVGKEGIVTRLDAAGNPSVRVGGKVYDFNKGEVVVVPDSPKETRAMSEQYVRALRRFYHGTGTAFDKPDAARFDPNGLYGPGYYVTSDSRVADSYAQQRQTLMPPLDELQRNRARAIEHIEWYSDPVNRRFTPNADEFLSHWQAALKSIDEEIALAKTGPNVRIINVPENLRLFDVDDAVDPNIADRMAPKYSALWEDLQQFAGKSATNDDVYNALAKLTGSRKIVNEWLRKAGYDGIRYPGGKRMPLKDATGNTIEHEVLVIFAESLPKLTNAIAGTAMGFSAKVNNEGARTMTDQYFSITLMDSTGDTETFTFCSPHAEAIKNDPEITVVNVQPAPPDTTYCETCDWQRTPDVRPATPGAPAGQRLATLEERISAIDDKIAIMGGNLPTTHLDTTPSLDVRPHAVHTEDDILPSVAEWVTGADDPGIVVDAGLARTTPCIRYELGAGKSLVFSRGIVGPLDEEQQALYCQNGIEVRVPTPGQQSRLQAMRSAATTCRIAAQGTNTREYLQSFFSCLGKELKDKGVEL